MARQVVACLPDLVAEFTFCNLNVPSATFLCEAGPEGHITCLSGKPALPAPSRVCVVLPTDQVGVTV